jgi:hypothetical protein
MFCSCLLFQGDFSLQPFLFYISSLCTKYRVRQRPFDDFDHSFNAAARAMRETALETAAAAAANNDPGRFIITCLGWITPWR